MILIMLFFSVYQFNLIKSISFNLLMTIDLINNSYNYILLELVLCSLYTAGG